MKRFLSLVLCAAVALAASGCSGNVYYEPNSSSAEIANTTPDTTSSYNSSKGTTDSTDNFASDTVREKINYGEPFTIDGVVVFSEGYISTSSYCLKLDTPISILLCNSMSQEEFDSDTLYFYNEPNLNGDYDYAQLCGKECTVTAHLVNCGTGDLFLEEPFIISDGNEAEKVDREPQVEIIKNYIGKWQDLGIGYSAPSGASRWDVEYRSNGTGTFYFVFGPNDIVTLDFNYTPFDTYLGQKADGILIELENGDSISYMVTYTWSNQLQKILMTMYEVKYDGAMNLDVYWVYAKV